MQVGGTHGAALGSLSPGLGTWLLVAALAVTWSKYPEQGEGQCLMSLLRGFGAGDIFVLHKFQYLTWAYGL